MIWLGGRGTVIAYLSALVMVSILYYFHHKLYRQNLLLLALLLCISCVVSLPVSIYEWNGLNRFMSIEQTLGAIESSSAIARLALWTESLEILSDRPWIGVGADGFKMFTSSRFFQPHNVIFQTLVEFGVVGTLCLIYLISRGAWFAISVCRRVCDPYLYPILAVVIALLVQSMVSGNLYHAGSIAQFLFFTSLALSRSAYLLSVKSNV
jgi:O-antigen ligase